MNVSLGTLHIVPHFGRMEAASKSRELRQEGQILWLTGCWMIEAGHTKTDKAKCRLFLKA